MITLIYFGDQALGRLLVLSQVVLSLQLGFAVIPLIHFNSDKKTMQEFAIKPWVKVLAWISAAIIVYLNIQLVIGEITGWIETSGNNKLLIYVLVIPVVLSCLALLMYIFIHPLMSSRSDDKNQLPHGQAEIFTEGEALPGYSRIGIAIDFSGNDQRVIRHALNQGGKLATYTLIYVVESAAARYLGKDTLDHETQQDKDNLRQYQDQLTEMGYQTNRQIGFGNPAREIAHLVTTQNIDLLVMGAHGHKGLKDLVFGTTLDAVRHKINVPILIVN